MGTDTELRKHLLALLDGKGAHLDFEAAVAGWPAAARGVKPTGAAHTAWQLVEHLRLAQRDILDFCVDAAYVEGSFPDDYWPSTESPPDADAWSRSIAAFRSDLASVKELVSDPETDLFASVPAGTGQTFLREALLVADHNAYHIGQLALLRRLVQS